jgi:hypothetical protein
MQDVQVRAVDNKRGAAGTAQGCLAALVALRWTEHRERGAREDNEGSKTAQNNTERTSFMCWALYRLLAKARHMARQAVETTARRTEDRRCLNTQIQCE